MSTKTILVTGASGLLGSNFSLEAISRGFSVVAQCNDLHLSFPGTPCHVGDLTDISYASELIDEIKPAWVIHLAALTDVDWCESHAETARRVNARTPGRLAALAHEAGSRFVYMSTDSVFAGDSAAGYREEELPRPVNVYARSKLAGEKDVLQSHPEALVVRSNIYGWNLQNKTSLSEWILCKLAGGETVPGFTDCVFAPLLVNDLSNLIMDAMQANLHGLYHIAAADACSKYEFARLIAKEFGYSGDLIRPVLMADMRLDAPRPRNTYLRADKLVGALRCRLPLMAEGIRRFRELRENGWVQQLKKCGGQP